MRYETLGLFITSLDLGLFESSNEVDEGILQIRILLFKARHFCNVIYRGKMNFR